MNVEDVLKSKGKAIYRVHVGAIIHDALQVMSEKNIGALLVVDDSDAVQGIITERDIIRHCHGSAGNIRGMEVKAVMTPREKLLVAHPHADINDVMALMTDRHIRHLPVVDEAEHKPVGMISIGDIVKALLVSRESEIRQLKDYIEFKYPA